MTERDENVSIEEFAPADEAVDIPEQEQVDAFDLIYNVTRPHQALPGRATPQAAWDATPKAEVGRVVEILDIVKQRGARRVALLNR